jgi:hypothetical protein
VSNSWNLTDELPQLSTSTFMSLPYRYMMNLNFNYGLLGTKQLNQILKIKNQNDILNIKMEKYKCNH